MKQLVRGVSLLLVFAILLAVPAHAEENISTRSSSYFLCSSAYLSKYSSTMFYACFDVTGVKTMDVIGASQIKIQRSSDGENWTTMKTYSMEDNTNLVCENTTCHAASVLYVGTRGYYYRAYIKLYARNSSGTAYWERYTSSIYLS